MLKSSASSTSSNCRPWWLLLVLALFLGGQTLAALHHHDEEMTNKGQIPDHDCALCVYASTAMAAIASSIWQVAVPLFAAVWFTCRVSVRRAAVRFNDPRAPPALLI